jgi:predicted nucleotidyltransferase
MENNVLAQGPIVIEDDFILEGKQKVDAPKEATSSDKLTKIFKPKNIDKKDTSFEAGKSSDKTEKNLSRKNQDLDTQNNLLSSEKIQSLEQQRNFPPVEFPTLKWISKKDIAFDFAEKVYIKFDKLIKAVVLFGSVAKQTDQVDSDVDIIIIIDDAMVKFDQQLIAWYREELGKLMQANPYQSELHINTMKLTTWWNDLFRGDPTAINIVRYGESIIDFGGFFTPLKILLQQGNIRLTPEAIYTCLNRVPEHITRSKRAEISAIEGCYWAMVDASQALLMAVRVLPPSPEHIPVLLKEHFVDKKLLNIRYVSWYRDLFELHKRIVHGEVTGLKGEIIDGWQLRADEFFKVCLKLIDDIL